MSLGSFSTIVAATVSLSSLAVLLAQGSLPPRAAGAFAFGAALAGLNAIASMTLLAWSRQRSHVAFMRALLGGMVSRMAVMLVAVALGLLFLDLPRMPLVIGLLSHFAVFLCFELAVVHRGFKPAGVP